MVDAVQSKILRQIRFEHSNQPFSARFAFAKPASDWIEKKSNRKAMNRNWSNQKSNPAIKTKAGNK